MKEIERAKQACKERLLDGDNILMNVQTLTMKYSTAALRADITVFWDNGSTCSVIVAEVAEKFGLYGEPITITINTVTGSKKHETKLYAVELLDRNDNVHILRAICLPSIGGPLPRINLESGLQLEFSEEVQRAWEDVIMSPIGCIDLLIGSEKAPWHPRFKEESGDLAIKTCPLFGQEMILWGSHPAISCQKIPFSEGVKAIGLGSYARIDKLGITYEQRRDFMAFPDPVVLAKMQKTCLETDWEENSAKKQTVDKVAPTDFWTAEGLGCEAPQRCKSCRKCNDCSFSGRQVTSKEAWEKGKMEERIFYDADRKRFRVHYFFLDDPAKLPDNGDRVLKMAIKEEAKLLREGRTAQANIVVHKMIDIGTLELITEEMDRIWDGPRHYVPLQHVINEASATTPLRIVSNTSLVDPKTGISLNGMLAKGPATLNDCWEIMLRYRCYDETVLTDIWKAYFHVLTGELEFHVRRVYWRDGDVTAKWRIYGFRTISMGDRPAACSLEIVVAMIVEMFGHIDPVASQRILGDRYVDDLPTGGTKHEVNRFVGTEKEDLQCTGTIPEIFRNTDLKLKVIARSGETDGKKLQLLGGAVLGLGYSAENDRLAIKFKANVSTRKRGVPTGPDLTKKTVDDMDPALLSARICLGLTNTQFDHISLATPITIQLKCAMKKLFRDKIPWDGSLPEEHQKEWENW